MSDVPCALTNGCYFDSENVIGDALEKSLPIKLPEGSDDILRRLELSQEDVDASQELVLLTPRRPNGRLLLLDYNFAVPSSFTPRTIAVVYNFTIGESPSMGQFLVRPSEDEEGEDDEEDGDDNEDRDAEKDEDDVEEEDEDDEDEDDVEEDDEDDEDEDDVEEEDEAEEGDDDSDVENDKQEEVKEETAVDMRIDSNRFWIFLYAYRILVGRFPELQPHIIYATLAERSLSTASDDIYRIWAKDDDGILYEINFLEIANHYGKYRPISKLKLDDDEAEETKLLTDAEFFWWYLLRDKSRTADQIVHEAWLGKGRLFSLVRADRFPHVEPALVILPGAPDATFTEMPLDVLHYLCSTYLSIEDASSLLALSRTLRHNLMPFVNSFAHKRIIQERPWYLPIQRAACLRGNEEMKTWSKMWGDQIDNIPWWVYANACTLTPSIRNRERIWRIAGRFRAEAERLGWVKGLL